MQSDTASDHFSMKSVTRRCSCCSAVSTAWSRTVLALTGDRNRSTLFAAMLAAFPMPSPLAGCCGSCIFTSFSDDVGCSALDEIADALTKPGATTGAQEKSDDSDV